MPFFVGTSGYSYKEWKGGFYPESLAQREMLSYYAERFSAVEINNSFYRLPEPDVVRSWTKQTPESFRFVLKAPQTITHRKRLKECRDDVKAFLKTAAVLKRRQGPVLFQLPPNFKKDLPRLDAFLDLITRTPVAFEFRHESWFDEETFECLRAHNCALCIADAADLPAVKLTKTADWGMVRLRRERYTRKQLADWLQRLQSQDWREVYVFFKHEDTGTGPKLAARLLQLIAACS